MAINFEANALLADEAAKLFRAAGLDGSIVFASRVGAVAAKRGSEAYDEGEAALSKQIRELSVSLAPNVRVNGISLAAGVERSTVFPSAGDSAEAILFLAGPRARSITGLVIPVAGSVTEAFLR